MSNEYGNIVPHDLHVGAEVFVIFTLEIQLNGWKRCKIVVCSSEEMQEANLETSLSSWAAERHMLGMMEGHGCPYAERPHERSETATKFWSMSSAHPPMLTLAASWTSVHVQLRGDSTPLVMMRWVDKSR